jgi:hypothetical protein
MLNAIPIKIPMTFITEIRKSNLKFIWKHKRLQIDKPMLSKKSNTGGITTPDFKLYYRAMAIKTVWYWEKNRHVVQWNRIEDPDTKQKSYIHIIFYKEAKNIPWKKRQPLQQMFLGKLDICMEKTETRSMSFTLHNLSTPSGLKTLI